MLFSLIRIDARPSMVRKGVGIAHGFRSVFSKIAIASGPPIHSRHAGGCGVNPERRRSTADFAGSVRARRPMLRAKSVLKDEAVKPTSRHVRYRWRGPAVVRGRQSFSGTKLMRRLAEYGLESADEMKRGQIHRARYRVADRHVRSADVRRKLSRARQSWRRARQFAPSIRIHVTGSRTELGQRASSRIIAHPAIIGSSGIDRHR